MSSTSEYNIREDSPFVCAEGLELPVRLGRLSGAGTPNRRITAVLHKGASDEPVFVAESKFTNLNQAIKNLREREGISESNFKSIGYVNLEADTQRSRMASVANRVKQWAEDNGFDAVVWTDLGANINFQPQSHGREILSLLAQDSVLLSNTQKYIKDLPTAPNLLQQEILEQGNDLSPEDYRASLTADFSIRDAMPQSDVPKIKWFDPQFDTWGPRAKLFPPVNAPSNVADPIQWKRDRIIEVAKHFKGTPYKRYDGKRGHFPARGCGLDCSNFAAWVYNYGLGIKFTSNVNHLISGNGPNTQGAGRKLSPNEPLKPGDLIFFKTHPRHVVIYIDENHIIDSTSGQTGVDVRDVTKNQHKWCRPHPDNPLFICARRPIE